MPHLDSWLWRLLMDVGGITYNVMSMISAMAPGVIPCRDYLNRAGREIDQSARMLMQLHTSHYAGKRPLCILYGA